jgi:hypothetical protein
MECSLADRLFIAVIGTRDAGKSTTWNTLFGHEVRTGKEPRKLRLNDDGLSTEVFLISGSNEERGRYAAEVLSDVDCRIVLCSVQYTDDAFESTWNHIFQEGFAIYGQWLNPGHDGIGYFDRLGVSNILLQHDAVISIRDGRAGHERLQYRVEEIRQYVHGWAAARGLIF